MLPRYQSPCGCDYIPATEFKYVVHPCESHAEATTGDRASWQALRTFIRRMRVGAES